MEPAAATVLLVEDHVITRRFLADNLTADGYTVLQAGSLAEARRGLEQGRPDLCLADLALPDGDGLDLLREVRAGDGRTGAVDPDLPVIVLSGRAGELDRLRGFGLGCDDYVAKPFSYQELHARIQVLLRRVRARPRDRRIRLGALEIDPAGRRARLHGRSLHLSKTEFSLLMTLAADPTRVYTRTELLCAVWGFQNPQPTRTLDSHAARLRRKLRAQGDHFLINVWGVGYRLLEEAPS